MFYIPGLFIVSFNQKNLLDDNSNNVNMITSKFKIGDEIKEFNSIPINNKIVWYQEIMKYIITGAAIAWALYMADKYLFF